MSDAIDFIDRVVDETARKLAEKEEEMERFREYVEKLDKIFKKLEKEPPDVREAIVMYLFDTVKRLIPPADLASILLAEMVEVGNVLRNFKVAAEKLLPIVLQRAKQLEEMR